MNQGRARFCSFGAVGECTKSAYMPSTAHKAFFLTSHVKRKNSNMFFNGHFMMFIKNFFKDCFLKLDFLHAFFIL
jgi:hypothetical protein